MQQRPAVEATGRLYRDLPIIIRAPGGGVTDQPEADLRKQGGRVRLVGLYCTG